MRVHIKSPTREFEYEARPGVSSFVIGNRKYDEVCLEEDPGVSGPHVRLEQFIGKWSFTDQFSNAGTIHNGTKKNNGELAPGDTLLLGATLVTVASIDAPRRKDEIAAPKVSAVPAADEFRVDPLALQADFKAEWPAELDRGVSEAESELRGQPEDNTQVAAAPEPRIARAPTHEAAAPGPASVFEQRIAALLVAQFMQDGGLDPRRDAAAMQRINEAARITVATLANARSSWVNLPFLMADATGPKHLKLEVHRRHLHERAPDEQTPERQDKSPRNEAQATGPKPNKLAGALVASLIISVAITAIVVPIVSDSDQPDPPTPADMVREATEHRVELNRQISEALKPLTDSNSTVPPEDALEAVEAMVRTMPGDAANAGAQFDAALRTLKNRVYAGMQKHSSAVFLEVRELETKGDLRAADAAIQALAEHANGDRHRKEAADLLKLPKSIEGVKTRIEDSSRRLLSNRMPRADAELALRDYAGAHEALAAVAQGALLTRDQLTWLRAEVALWETAAQKQAEGLIEPPLKGPPRPPSLPVTLRNELLPGGSTQLARAASGMQGKVVEAFRAGTLSDVDVIYFGHPAKVSGKPRSSMLTARVTRSFAAQVRSGGAIEYTTETTIFNLPADTQVALMLALPAPTVENLLGIMQHCFQNGLPEKAGEVAFRIREAVPEKKAALDEILGIKWDKPVPEGGFPERDGKIVPE